MNPATGMTYARYLALDNLLAARSRNQRGWTKMMFIVIHQTRNCG